MFPMPKGVQDHASPVRCVRRCSLVIAHVNAHIPSLKIRLFLIIHVIRVGSGATCADPECADPNDCQADEVASCCGAIDDANADGTLDGTIDDANADGTIAPDGATHAHVGSAIVGLAMVAMFFEL